ncbi:MAG: penicillin-binding protein 2 [Bacteroidales bacterium]|nr:penicillin-binding protein 2 [Bacteroidales bacterium]
MRSYENRKWFFIYFFIFVFIILTIRVFYIQIINPTYKTLAEQNTLRYVYEYPQRGTIYDAEGRLLAWWRPVYNLSIIPFELEPFDTIKLANLLELTQEQLTSRIEKAKKMGGYQPITIYEDLSDFVVSYLYEHESEYKGILLEKRFMRDYPLKIGAHFLGYISEVNPKKLEEDAYYRMGDYIGVTGLEEFYEKELRGRKGVKVYVADVHNRIVGRYQNGLLDSSLVNGKNLYTSIDADLQSYGEDLMNNKRGAIVAINPKTGEIITLVSAPSYDPNLLTGRNRSMNYLMLSNDVKNHPLYNRATMTRYPPGSTFKIVNGLAALQENFINEKTFFSCYGGYRIASHTIGCHGHPSPTNIISAIQYSCNTYFCQVFKVFVDNKYFSKSSIGYERWRYYVNSLGFGVELGIDLPNEYGGFVPTAEYYNRLKGTRNWRADGVISVAIGQGEIGATPLQLANLATIIANRGWYIPPHIVRAVGHPDSLNKRYNTKIVVPINQNYFDLIIEGMEKAVTAGTATIAMLPEIRVAAKTGTAQDPPRKSHSVFIAFAPVDNPKIAIGVLVENAGWGASYAGPIASLMIEKYLTDTVKRIDLENRMKVAEILNK